MVYLPGYEIANSQNLANSQDGVSMRNTTQRTSSQKLIYEKLTVKRNCCICSIVCKVKKKLAVFEVILPILYLLLLLQVNICFMF